MHKRLAKQGQEHFDFIQQCVESLSNRGQDEDDALQICQLLWEEGQIDWEELSAGEFQMKHESLFKAPRIAPSPGRNLFTRALTVRALASLHRQNVRAVAAEMWPDDRALLQMVTRATSTSATTTVSGWAMELAHKIVNDTLDAMGAASAAAEVMQQSLVLEWNGAGQITAPGFVASANNASFVQEGNPIPVRQLSETGAVLNPFKLAALAALSREMMESSNAEKLIADVIVRSCGLALDSVFFGSGAATSAQPAGIRNGIAALTPSASADPFGAFFEDMAQLLNAVSAVGGNGPFILVGNAGRMASAQARYAKEEGETPSVMFMASSAVGADVLAIAPQALVCAISAEPEVDVTPAATLVMDTSPGPAHAPGSGMKSMWQTDSFAVKVRWPCCWSLRSSAACAWVTPSWK
jgi:hypothetical protein